MNKKRIISGISALLLAFSTVLESVPVTTSITSYALTSPWHYEFIEALGDDKFLFDENGNTIETVAEAAERFTKENITSDMSTYEKVEAILYFISKTMNAEDYSCLAAAQDVMYFCAYLDIPCNLRTAAATDLSGGANHEANVISIDGVSYIADASYYGGRYNLISCKEYTWYRKGKGFSDGNFAYHVNDDGTASIDSCFLFGADQITFPTEINGYPITEIGRIEYADSNSIVSLNIPDGFSLIDQYNFDGSGREFLKLETVSLGDGVTELPKSCFLECKKLKNINLNNITILRNESLRETAIEYADISKVTILESAALADCKNLEEVKLNDKLTCIPELVLSNCPSLKNLTIPETVTEIQDYAFRKCTNLILDVPDSVVTFGVDCFEDIKLVRCNYGSAAQKYCSANNIPYECYNAPNIGDVTTVKLYRSASKADMYEINDTSLTYDGKEKNIYIKVFDEDGKVVDPKYYDYEVTKNINVGNAVINITGKSRYSGTMTVTAKINPCDISKKWKSSFKFAKIATYTGSEVTVPPRPYTVFNAPLVENVDYTLSYSNNVNAGVNTGECKVTGIGNFTGSFVKNFSINQAFLSDAQISIPDQEYTGKPVIPKASIIFNDKELVENVDYTVAYSNNTKVGYANAEFTGIGNFQGTKLIRFPIKKHVHSYGNWIVNKEATCTEEGTRSRTCSGCEDSETEKIPKTEHKLNDDIVNLVNPTCTEKGYTVHHCELCGSEVKADYTDPLGHSYRDWTINKEATCTKEGSRSRVCSKCGGSETEDIPKTEHKMSDDIVKPTCTEKGYTVHHCELCGKEVKDNYTKALGHSYGSWRTTKPADCKNSGIRERTCSRCHKTEERTIAKKSHSYKTTVIAPTYAAKGYTLHKCSNCGYSYKDNYTAKKTIKKVTPTKFSCSSTSIKINWKKVTDASGYKVYRYNSSTKKWDAVKTISNGNTLNYKQTGLKSGTTYQYKIRAYVKYSGKTYWGDYSQKMVTTTRPAKVSFKSSYTATKNSIRINWTPVTGATGYRIYRYDSSTKKWKTVTTIKNGNTKSYTIKKLKSKTSYKFRIKAYRKVNNVNYWGDYSSIKKIKTK